VCNVCNGDLSCAPPARHELMETFTGPELAALICPGYTIGAHQVFSEELGRQLETLDDFNRERSGYLHWQQGAYLITTVASDDGRCEVPIADSSQMRSLCSQLDENMCIMNHAKTLRLVPAGSLSGVEFADLGTQQEFWAAMQSIQFPGVLHFASTEESTMGDDHISAVNLSRPLASPPRPSLVDHAVYNVTSKHPNASRVELRHYSGGPCGEDAVATCLVPGGTGSGWSIVKDIEAAITMAYARVVAKKVDEQGEVVRGQSVKLQGLKSRPDLNGKVGVALQFCPENGRWRVRLADGDGKELKPANLEPLEGSHGRVFIFWGDAQWSRTQLLGEIARGHWGLARSSVADVTLPPSEVWPSMWDAGRMAFAPVTEMTEDFMKAGFIQMDQLRAAGNLPTLDEVEAEEDP